MKNQADPEYVYYGDSETIAGRVLMAGRMHANHGVPREEMRDLRAYGFVYVDSGQGFFLDSTGKERAVLEGCLLLLFPGEPHAYGNAREAWSECFIVIDGPFMRAWEQLGLIDRKDPVWALDPIDYWLPRMRSAIENSPGEPFKESILPIFRFQEWLAEARHHVDSKRGLISPDHSWIKKAQSAIEAQIPNEIDWAAVARRCGTSWETFRKRFTREAGLSPGQFRSRRIMDRACLMLGSSDQSIKEISATLGYCDPYHFSKSFKRILGLSPTAFRRHYFPSMKNK
jgi:AraC-like DNA-binding protein